MNETSAVVAAQPITEAATGNRYLSFSLGTEEYAIPLLAVKEVIAMPEFTSVPYTPSHFLGIMNLRGQVISVMDLRKKLGIKPGSTAETAVIICDLSPLCIGVVVD
jgi:purine-binding chemotaxis protein CheW